MNNWPCLFTHNSVMEHILEPGKARRKRLCGSNSCTSEWQAGYYDGMQVPQDKTGNLRASLCGMDSPGR